MLLSLFLLCSQSWLSHSQLRDLCPLSAIHTSLSGSQMCCDLASRLSNSWVWVWVWVWEFQNNSYSFLWFADNSMKNMYIHIYCIDRKMTNYEKSYLVCGGVFFYQFSPSFLSQILITHSSSKLEDFIEEKQSWNRWLCQNGGWWKMEIVQINVWHTDMWTYLFISGALCGTGPLFCSRQTAKQMKEVTLGKSSRPRSQAFCSLSCVNGVQLVVGNVNCFFCSWRK